MITPIVTELPRRLEAVTLDPFAEPEQPVHARAGVMNYVECDLAPEVSLPQWRRTRAAARRRPALTFRGCVGLIRPGAPVPA